MKIINRKMSPRYKRDSIESFLLISGKTAGSGKLSITLVEMQPGGFQHIHNHEPEQVYYILHGEGIMNVDDEEQSVTGGDCIFIPSFSRHGLKNTGSVPLNYLSACSPPFTMKECDELWPLKSLEETDREKH
jgi:mannose-6-phosphate isomerase-like protein (cupin superfamily)